MLDLCLWWDVQRTLIMNGLYSVQTGCLSEHLPRQHRKPECWGCSVTSIHSVAGGPVLPGR